MDNEIISDDMKKESKLWRSPMIVSFSLAILFPLVLIWNTLTTTEFVLGLLAFIILGCFFLYGYLYAIKYRVSISIEKIMVKTLFRKVELNMTDIISFSCKRYRKSVFYKFRLSTKEKRLMLSTRYKDEFIKLLEENKTR